MLSPFECLCGNFILPEPASYVFFYAIFNLRNLFYLIYRWERELLTAADQAPCSGVPAVTFAELPEPKKMSRNVSERCATLRIGSASLDIYPGCDAEQLKMLVELLRLC